MKTLLCINASGRQTRSITRKLTRRFVDRWRTAHPDGRVIDRDVGGVASDPPPCVNERWIAAAFSAPATRSEGQRAALALSETLIAEIESAELIVLGAPIYNFGMPAQLKAYFDQIVRVGRTFAYEPGRAEPYRPLLEDKPVIVVVSAGDGAIHPGGPLEGMNHLEPHLRTVFDFIGIRSLEFVRVGYEEFADERLRDSIDAAERALDRRSLAARGPAGSPDDRA